MKKPDQLNKLFDSPVVPAHLQSQLRANWQHQQQSRIRGSHWAVAALILLTVAMLFSIDQTPEVVHAAFKDLREAEKHPATLAISPSYLRDHYGLKTATSSLALALTKYCSIDGQQMAHIRLDDNRLGEVHLFLYQGSFTHYPWSNSDGNFHNKRWQTLQIHENLSVLVIYSQQDDAHPVQQFTRELFTLS